MLSKESLVLYLGVLACLWLLVSPVVLATNSAAGKIIFNCDVVFITTFIYAYDDFTSDFIYKIQ